MFKTAFINSIKRGVRKLTERRLYIFAMVVIPLFVTFFLLGLMKNGLPNHIPTAIVDLDNSTASREVVRTLNSSVEVDLNHKVNSYVEAYELMQKGEIYGFFIIPHNFMRDAMAGREPQIAYYTNSTFYVPGSLLYRSLRTTSTLTSASIVKAYLVSSGATEKQAMDLLQPVQLLTNPVHNPWTNYAIYLVNSFAPCALALMILLVTIFSICHEEKMGTSREWIKTADGSMYVALLGKLLPQTLIFAAVGFLMQSILYGYYGFPLNCNPWNMIGAMILFVMANQAFGVMIAGIMPNLRLGLSIASLIGILSFSVGAFSFPLEDMYSPIAIFAYILPVRYYFLIYVDQALNGFPLYYSRLYYAALLAFLLLPALVLKRMKKANMNPVYVP